MLAKLVGEMQEYEKACYLALAAYSGRRKSELFRFKVEYFDDAHLIAEASCITQRENQNKGRGGIARIGWVQPYHLVGIRKENGIESEWLPAHDKMGSKHSKSWSHLFGFLGACVHPFLQAFSRLRNCCAWDSRTALSKCLGGQAGLLAHRDQSRIWKILSKLFNRLILMVKKRPQRYVLRKARCVSCGYRKRKIKLLVSRTMVRASAVLDTYKAPILFFNIYIQHYTPKFIIPTNPHLILASLRNTARIL